MGITARCPPTTAETALLTSLLIQNFTLASSLEVDFATGMTALTGETGAGKSLVIDALGMALGDRADGERIRAGADRADIAATFAIDSNPRACAWLDANDYHHQGECLLRRVLTREGRSRGTVNGQPATMQQLQELGELLVDIHSQHEHQSLLRRDTHRRLLDEFAGQQVLAAEVAAAHRAWRTAAQRLAELENAANTRAARLELLQFQVQELDQLELVDGEIDQLEHQQRLLANIDTLLHHSQQVLALCAGDDSDQPFDILSALGRATALLGALPDKTAPLHEAAELLTSAHIQVAEAISALHHHVDDLDLDPARLRQVEDRLGAAYQLARKHRVPPEQLPARHRELAVELAALATSDETLAALAATATALHTSYQRSAQRLSAGRRQAAGLFAAAVNSELGKLAMTGATVEIALAPLDDARQGAQGLETVDLVISTNPGQPHRPLARVASGGELSRISLAIQVVAARRSTIPTLVFDEIDVGIGGGTAAVVGQMLRELGARGQVVCVTHLPQVASCAHHHLVVAKAQGGDGAETGLRALVEDERIDEIARMLGGLTLTRQTLDHAREMLAMSGGWRRPVPSDMGPTTG